MSKVIAVTIGSAMLMVDNKHEIPWNRPAVVPYNVLVQDRVGKKQVEVLAELPEQATDAEFLEFWNESKDAEDRDQLAADSYQSALEEKLAAEAEAAEAEAEKEPAKKAPAKKAPAKKAPAKPATETE